jgi:hypothetical protein
MFETNYTLTEIKWRLDSRKSFALSKCVTRNKDLARRGGTIPTFTNPNPIEVLLPVASEVSEVSEAEAQHKAPEAMRETASMDGVLEQQQQLQQKEQELNEREKELKRRAMEVERRLEEGEGKRAGGTMRRLSLGEQQQLELARAQQAKAEALAEKLEQELSEQRTKAQGLVQQVRFHSYVHPHIHSHTCCAVTNYACCAVTNYALVLCLICTNH